MSKGKKKLKVIPLGGLGEIGRISLFLNMEMICRSMINVSKKAMELGYLKIPEGVLIDIERIKSYRQEKLVIISTGSQ